MEQLVESTTATAAIMEPVKPQTNRISTSTDDSGYQSKSPTPQPSNGNNDAEAEIEQQTVDPDTQLIESALYKPEFPPPAQDGENIFESTEPPVPAVKKLRFLGWCVSVAAAQCWKDTKTLHMPSVLATPFNRDLFSHFVMVPMANKEPRLLASGPGAHIELYRLEDVEAYSNGNIQSLQGLPTLQLINLASNNYGGFAQLEPGALKLQQQALKKLPMTPAPPALEEAVRHEFTRFLGFDACEITSSGFNCNMLAFKTAVDVAEAQRRPCIFLCDRESHSSMWTGAYSNKGAKTLKFNHNCMTDLDAQLRYCQRNWPEALVCVAIEGTYSMEGTVPPLPAILALKKTYGFKLLVDEAHSFLGLGSSGRGSFEYWQDRGFDCPLEEADFLTCTFSKSVGCLGGAVLANGEFALHMRPEADTVTGPCGKGVASAVLVRVLQLLRKKTLIRYRMAMLKEKSFYVARRLASAGCKILGSPGSPNVCFPVGTMQCLSSCIKDSIENGIALSCGVPPATSLWCCRVRASIFSTMSWSDIDKAVVKISQISVAHRVPGIREIEPDKQLPTSGDSGHSAAELLEEEAIRVDRDIERLINELGNVADHNDGGISGLGRHSMVVDAGVAALQRYGVGPCSARHYYGSFDTYLELEKNLAEFYPCLMKQAGSCEALLCGDAQVSIGAAVAARAQVPRQKDAYTLVLVPGSSPFYVTSQLSAVKDASRCVIGTYKSTDELVRTIEAQHRKQQANGRKRCYLTLYMRSDDDLDLPGILKQLAPLKKSKSLLGTVILLDDTNGLGRLGPRRLGYLDQLEHTHGKSVLAEATSSIGGSRSVQIMVLGSWYEAFRHIGGYMIGPKALMDSLNFQNRGFIFSAPPLPLQTAMTSRALELLKSSS